ncbi:MAG: protein kinase [Verrucomicrobia bacterium]|nr:protein kinase [Verrucomicrobiota bacterium]
MKPDDNPILPTPPTGHRPEHPPPAIPDHEVLRRIGRGSYGEVWLARNLMGSYRAVKVVYRGQFAEDRPFDREFAGLRNFEPVSRSHPSQVSIFHVGRRDAEGYFYYVMELADDQQAGQQIDPDHYQPKTLRSVLNQNGRLPVAQCVEIGLALATALKHLHAAGLIHRDIKPSNVIFVHGLPKLADIGLVAAADTECSFVGTEGYVANEGPGRVQADVYALGKVLYEMLTGLRPEQHPGLPDGWEEPRDSPASALNEVILKACEANLQRRFQSADEVRVELEMVKLGKSVRRARWYQQAVRRTMLTSGVVAAATVLAALVFGFFVYRNEAAQQSARRTLREMEIIRTKNPMAGWFTKNCSQWSNAVAVLKDREALEQASAMLAGLDLRLVNYHSNFPGASVAFGPDGRAVLGGLGPETGMLMARNGELTPLPVQGEGPVCWPRYGPPLQAAIVSNRLVVRDALTGAIHRQFVEAAPLSTTTFGVPLTALSADGSYLAAATNGQVQLWSVDSGNRLVSIPATATALAFSPDSRQLAIGVEDGATLVHSTASGFDQLNVLPPRLRPAAIRVMAFARDPLIPYPSQTEMRNWSLATADESGAVVVWDLRQGSVRAFFHGSIWTVTALAFSPDGLLLAVAGQANGDLWDAVRGRRLLRFPVGTGQVRLLSFDHDGRRLVSGTEPGAQKPAIRLWDLEGGRGIRPLRGLREATRKVWLSPDGRRLAALSDDWRLGIWRMEDYELLGLFESPIGFLADNAGGAFDARSERFAFASGTEACLLDLRSRTTLHQWRLEAGYSDQLIFDDRGRLLLLRRERDTETQRWIWRLQELATAENPALLHQQTDPSWSPGGMAFLPGGARFLVWHGGHAGTEGMLRAIEVATGREVWHVNSGTTHGDLRVCLDPSGRRFAHNGYHPRPLRIFNIPSFEPAGVAAAACQAIGPNGEQFLLPQWYLPARLGDKGFPLKTDWTELAFVCAFSPDGNRLAWGTEEGEVLVADLPALRDWFAKAGR